MNKKISLFVIDDEPEFRDLMQRVLNGEEYRCEVFDGAAKLLEAVKEKEYDVGIIDLCMPDMGGLELLKRLKTSGASTEYIILTGQGTIATAIEAIKLGCYDYLVKPASISELKITVQRAYEKKAIRNENFALKRELQRTDRPCRIIGESAPTKRVISLIEKVAPTLSPVLVTGESGTGKELVARAVHNRSDRSSKPFIILDCAALSDQLLENELFGHERGAFTDAVSMKRGLFEVADGGTLFIDEIGEMKLSTQAKLLRVIETHQFRRLGSNHQMEVDVRIVAATNRNLAQEIVKGNFREDLFYRLNVFNIPLSPLRERKEDIPLLVNHFIENRHVSVPKKRIREEDLRLLMKYDWPGNIRELANVIERALIVSAGDYITPADFSIEFVTTAVPAGSIDGRGLDEIMNEYERQVIAAALKQCNYNKIETARLLKMGRSTLYRELEKLHLNDTDGNNSSVSRI